MRSCRFPAWFGSPLPLDPVLKAGVAHFWFVTIHPFDDGNGRIARAISEMVLTQADGTKDRFYSMSAGIEAKRRDYYLQLEAAQRRSTPSSPSARMTRPFATSANSSSAASS